LQKILIDENLSPSLAADAQLRGFLCSHVNHLGKAGTKDWELKRVILEGDWTFVTNNSIDFRGPAGKPGFAGEYADVRLHAGLVCIDAPLGLNLSLQRQLFAAVTIARPVGQQEGGIRRVADHAAVRAAIGQPDHARRMREHFPDLTFRTIDGTVEEWGRPFVPIQALIQAAKEASEDVCGIVNSDVEFRGDASFFEMVCKEVPGALVFGNRIDLSDNKLTTGKAFRNGYDFFFWDRANSALLEETPMVLGLPWWDFWLPLHAYAQGLRTKRFVSSSMIHIAHPIGWDILNYVKYAHLFAVSLASAFSRWRDERAPTERDFLHRLLATAATIPVDRQPHASLRRVGALCDLVNCLIDDLSETVTLRDAQSARGTLDLV